MMTGQDALELLRAEQADAANSGRDFGRGYAYACDILETALAAE